MAKKLSFIQKIPLVNAKVCRLRELGTLQAKTQKQSSTPFCDKRNI